MKKIFISLIGAILFQLIVANIWAQQKMGHDTTYYTTFPKNVVAVRLFLSQSYSTLYFRAEDAKDIGYQANNKLQLGAGFSKGDFSLSAAVGVADIHNKEQGKTTAFNLALRLFPRGWLVDVVTSINKGYHLNREDAFPVNSSSFYYRPDVRMSFFEADAFKVTNAKRFSFRSAITQSEWQKKSAGTLLYGAATSYGWMKGDSALVPAQYQNMYKQAGITRIDFFHIGPGIGYAYNLVISQHFFVMASLIGILNVNVTTEHKNASSDNSTSVLPGVLYKTAFGYNSSNWSVAADLAGNALLIKGELKEGGYIMPMGIYRFVITKKFGVK